MENQLYYYGTDLYQAGHYFWELEGVGMSRWQKNPRELLGHTKFPFDPYATLEVPKGKSRSKGDVYFQQRDGYSICAIEGSCKDDRWGTVSVFFVREELSRERLIERILTTPIAKKIIDQMPFDVRW